MRRDDPFAELSEWEPSTTEWARKACEEAFAQEAGVSVEKFHAAMGVLVFEGHYGPSGLSDDPDDMSLLVARTIVRAAQDASLPTVAYEHPHYGYVEIDETEIKRWRFRQLVEIYGDWRL